MGKEGVSCRLQGSEGRKKGKSTHQHGLSITTFVCWSADFPIFTLVASLAFRGPPSRRRSGSPVGSSDPERPHGAPRQKRSIGRW
ncbi:hypothetical protein NHX12_020307 [Muraenolepis orangiensis]|uniref:Uncharacterized protein n=1 Tax=Muraenolepis orangiensis TaxID=630683 RepID=A0A9Q0ERC8_9TELE|nr:hypothetical protein NHX12_020307 [Muraenolepis orangiensis]